MGYDLHIKRDGGISLEEWKRSLATIAYIRLEETPITVTNPRTGERITISGHDGDVAVMLDGEWVKVFGFFEGRIGFRARSVDLKDSTDKVAFAAFSLARILCKDYWGRGRRVSLNVRIFRHSATAWNNPSQ